jgi:hypothetical protein
LKAEHTRKYVSILNRFDELLNIHKNRREIPPILAGQHRHGHLGAFLRWVLEKKAEDGNIYQFQAAEVLR